MPDPAPNRLEIADCPECGLPAEIVDRVVVASTAGPVELVRTMCVRRHWFMMSRDFMKSDGRPASAGLRVHQPPMTVHRRGAGG